MIIKYLNGTSWNQTASNVGPPILSCFVNPSTYTWRYPKHSCWSCVHQLNAIVWRGRNCSDSAWHRKKSPGWTITRLPIGLDFYRLSLDYQWLWNLLVLNAGNGWEWGNGTIINNHYGSFTNSLRLAPWLWMWMSIYLCIQVWHIQGAFRRPL